MVNDSCLLGVYILNKANRTLIGSSFFWVPMRQTQVWTLHNLIEIKEDGKCSFRCMVLLCTIAASRSGEFILHLIVRLNCFLRSGILLGTLPQSSLWDKEAFTSSSAYTSQNTS